MESIATFSVAMTIAIFAMTIAIFASNKLNAESIIKGFLKRRPGFIADVIAAIQAHIETFGIFWLRQRFRHLIGIYILQRQTGNS